MGLSCGHLSLTRTHRPASRGTPRHTCDCLLQGARPLCPQHGRAWPCPSTALRSPVPPGTIPSVCTLVFLRRAIRVQLRGRASAGCACLSPTSLDSAVAVWLLFTLPWCLPEGQPSSPQAGWHLPHAPRADTSPSRSGPPCLLSKLLQSRGERWRRL